MTDILDQRCANCGILIGRLEKTFLWQEKVTCETCFLRLQASAASASAAIPYATPQPDNVVSTIIPYKNPYALISYYLGVFSLIPCIGALLGIAALILGIKGLKFARANPQAKGRAHAIVGIVLGSIFGLVWTLAIILPFIVALVAARRP